MTTCPKCGSQHTVRNGHIHNGKERFKCGDCGRQFVENPRNKVISQSTKELIDKLLLQKISLAGIARLTNVSQLWLQKYVKAKSKSVAKVNIRSEEKGI